MTQPHSISMAQQFPRHGTVVPSAGNSRYIGMAQQLHRYVTGHRLPVVCFEIGIELAWITDATLFQYIQNAFLLVR